MADTAHTAFFSAYAITEEDHTALCSLRDQLGFVNMLLCMHADQQVMVTAAQMHAFTDQLENVVNALINGLDTRLAAARDSQHMTWIDWHCMLLAASGMQSQPQSVLRRVTERLQSSVRGEPDMAPVYETWCRAITGNGDVSLQEVIGSADAGEGRAPQQSARRTRRRDKLVATA